MFLLYFNELDCVGSLVISAVITLLLLLALGVIG
jgi:hypothetical protein